MTTRIDEFGELNPEAPAELSQFAFLIGRWRGEGMSMNQEGKRAPYEMSWVGRYILDGCAIADEALILDEDGQPEAVFITYRSYDSVRKKWNIEALNVLDTSFRVQVAADRGKVVAKDDHITLEYGGPSGLGRETFMVASEDRFTYQLDFSLDDGATWTEAYDVIEAYRV